MSIELWAERPSADSMEFASEQKPRGVEKTSFHYQNRNNGRTLTCEWKAIDLQ